MRIKRKPIMIMMIMLIMIIMIIMFITIYVNNMTLTNILVSSTCFTHNTLYIYYIYIYIYIS